MISVSDLVHLRHLYPSGSLANPMYAFAGGTAVQCWLHNSMHKRDHKDIDVFAFNTGSLGLNLGIDLSEIPFFIGGFTQDGIVSYLHTAPIRLQIIQKSYFDAEFPPSIADVRSVTIGKTVIFALSPEFIVVSKLSYPNVHRLHDFQDVLVLNQCGCIQNADYLSALLAHTSLDKLIRAQDILSLKTQDNLQELVDSIHRQLIRRFLYWDRVNVDALNSFQIFMLLDMDDELLHLPPETLQFIDAMLVEADLGGRDFQVAKLGLHLLTMGIPERGLSVLHSPDFQTVIRRSLTLIPKRPGFWLSPSKNVLMIVRQLSRLEDLTGMQFDWIWTPATLVRIIQRVFFDDPSRFMLLTSVRSIYHDLKTSQVPVTGCTDLLQDLLTMPSPINCRIPAVEIAKVS